MKEEGSHFWCVCESAQPSMIWMVCKNDVWAFNGKWHMIHDTTIEDGIFWQLHYSDVQQRYTQDRMNFANTLNITLVHSSFLVFLIHRRLEN